MKNLSFIDKLIFIINSILATILLLSYLLPFVSPKSIPFFAILSLFVPFLIILNLFFSIYWLLKLKKQFFLSVLILTIGWLFSSPFYKLTSKNSSLNKDLKVMSFNVKTFELFNIKENSNSYNNGYELISQLNPDILSIQEYYQNKNNDIKYPYKFIKYKSKKNKFGMAIYSKFKIINSGSLDFKNTTNNAIFVDILKNKDTVRVYNLHLESLKIKPNEENFGEENSEKLIKRIGNSFKVQAEQTELFLAHEKNWRGKKIICGDLNNTSFSWVYNKISKNKKDAFIEAGEGFGKTFNYWFPMRIDFIFSDVNSKINKYNLIDDKFSDHFPVLARINW